MLEGGAAIGARTLDGSTPLHLACTLLKAPAARLLLRRGADELAVNNARQTPADVAGLFLSASCGRGGPAGKEEEEDHRHEEGFNELLGDIKGDLERAPADRAWARRGWLVMARARLLRGRRQRGDLCGGGSGGGERLVEESEAHHEEGRGHDIDGRFRATSVRAAAAAAVAVMTVEPVLGDKRARRGDGAAVDEARESGGGRKRPCRGDVVRQSVGDDDGGAGASAAGGGVLGIDGSGSPCAAAGLGLVARVTGIKEDGIFQNILSFL